MDPHTSMSTLLAHKDLPLLEYVVEFSQLAVLTAFYDAALNSLHHWTELERSYYPMRSPTSVTNEPSIDRAEDRCGADAAND
ncbi:hypothetical protein M9458_043563, partial [Cirrhinus mrigala]